MGRRYSGIWRFSRRLCGVSLLVALSGQAYASPPIYCDPPPTPTSNRPIPEPFVQVAPNPAAAGDTVTLDASASTGAISTYHWSGPPEIVIENASSSMASFVAPEVNDRTVIVIELKLTSYGLAPGNSERVEIAILPPKTVEMVVDDAIDSPGSTVQVGVTLRSVGQEVVAVANEIQFGRYAFIRGTEGGTPDCSANEDLSIEAASFEFVPKGCTPEVDCSAVSAQVTTAEAIPDRSVVYECRVFLSTERTDFVETCRHGLPCSGLGAMGSSQEPLGLACVDGSATAETGDSSLTLEVSVAPPTPSVGDLVRIGVSADGGGGRPVYRLRGFWPFLETDVAMISGSFFYPVEFELRAVCPGTVTLFAAVSFEVNGGCPGSEAHHRTEGGESFELEILPGPTYSIRGTVAEFPDGCSGAVRGISVRLDPLDLETRTDMDVGNFSFENVPAGEYTLAVGPRCNPHGCWTPTIVTVTDSDVDVRICPIETTPTPTPTPGAECPGDCDANGTVGVDEVVLAIGAAMAENPPVCGVDVNFDGRVEIDELVLVVRAALVGCL